MRPEPRLATKLTHTPRRGCSAWLGRAFAPGYLMPLLLTACQTTAPTEPVRLPVLLSPLFSTCEPADGALTLQIFLGGNFLGSADGDWIAKDSSNVALQLASSVGTQLLLLEIQGNQVALSGSAASRVPELSLTEGGFLRLGGHMVGLKATELACLLGLRMPHTWTQYVTAAEVNTAAETAQIKMADGERTIELDVHGLGKPEAETVCAQINWWSYLVFEHGLKYCRTSPRGGELTGVDAYAVKWVKVDDKM